MFKRALFVTLQTLLLLAMFLAGSLLPALNKLPMWRVALGPTRFFVLDGMVLMLLTFAVLLGIEAATRKVRRAGPWTVLALVLATALGMAMRFPFMGS